MNPEQQVSKVYNYNLLLKNGLGNYISTDVNLLEMYKSALLTGAKSISWEKGAIDLDTICGIIDNTY